MPVIERPNILFCIFDSLSLSDSRLLSEVEEYPALSRLKTNSALFSRTYAPCPESSPARASLFTGLDPCVHGLWTDGVSLAETERTFPKRLAQAGYTTALIGRRQLAGVSQWTTEQIPPDEYTYAEWAHGPLHRSRQNSYLSWLQQTSPENYSGLFETQANPAFTQLTQHQRNALESLPDSLSFNHWVGERIGKWIDSQPSSQPFLAVAGFSVGDLLGTEPQAKHNDEALNELAMQQADDAIGKLLNKLEASSRADDTVIIITSGRGNQNTSTTDNLVSEQAIKVPLLIRRTEHKHTVETSPVSTIDIAPTILELANVPIGPRMQGKSLLSVLNNSTPPRGWAMSRLRRLSSSLSRNWQTALCASPMKLVVHHGTTGDATPATYQLYNLDIDPQERDNLADQETHAEMLEQMIDLMIDARCALEDRTEPRIAEF